MFNLADALFISDKRVTGDGYLVVTARAARTGIQLYKGFELGKPEVDTIRVYRPEDSVFATDTMGSFAHKPITNDHPPTMVNSENWKDYAVGIVGGDVVRDGEFVRIPLAMMDKAAITALESGKRELSAGYQCELEWTPGKTPKGEAYDAIQKSIKINHVALVDAGRAGTVCGIDSKPTDDNGGHNKPQGSDMTLQKMTIDGISVEVSDVAAQVMSKVVGQLTETRQKLADSETAALKAAAENAKAIEAKDKEIEDLKKKVLDDAAVDRAIEDRTNVLVTAKTLLGDGYDPKGKSTAQIRRDAVSKRLGADKVKDKSDDAVAVAFDTLVSVGGTGDVLRDGLGNLPPQSGNGGNAAQTAYEKYLADMRGAWNTDQKGAA